ncbi:MAG: PTS sugar transporter subunit IIA [Aestuariivirgaceae bacterium]|nr:PTS sugar transporter subunit IIA [Aestuariivirgaceae bacterium]
MNTTEFLQPQAVLPQLRAATKKQLLTELGAAAAEQLELDPRRVYETLHQREMLGSTGLGQAIAIPHGKMPGLTRVHGLFARLVTPVDFDAVDDQPVDLVFMLLAPEKAGADHLKALACISRLMRDVELVQKLRGTNNAAGLYSLLTEPALSESPHAA